LLHQLTYLFHFTYSHVYESQFYASDGDDSHSEVTLSAVVVVLMSSPVAQLETAVSVVVMLVDAVVLLLVETVQSEE
jgi:hypothetical protein